GRKRLIDLFGGFRLSNSRQVKKWWQRFEGFHGLPAFAQWTLEKTLTGEPEQIECSKANGHFFLHKQISFVPAETLLKLRERQNLLLLHSHNLAIEDKIRRNFTRGICQLQKCAGYLFEVPRIKRHPSAHLVQLASDAVVFVLDPHRRNAGIVSQTFPNGLRGFFRRGEH